MNKRKDIIPNNLKEFRLKAGLTQKQVAEMLGLQCEDRLSHWEKGIAMPNIINLMKLMKIYNTNLESLYSSFE
jgi:transcriptional regulator with XRE-family HTH domain